MTYKIEFLLFIMFLFFTFNVSDLKAQGVELQNLENENYCNSIPEIDFDVSTSDLENQFTIALTELLQDSNVEFIPLLIRCGFEAVAEIEAQTANPQMRDLIVSQGAVSLHVVSMEQLRFANRREVRVLIYRNSAQEISQFEVHVFDRHL